MSAPQSSLDAAPAGRTIPSSPTYQDLMGQARRLATEFVRQNEDGTGKLTLPAEAEVFSIHATYDNATLIYANCDADKDRGSAEHAPSPDRWYPVASVLSSGVVAPNNCVGKKVPERLQVIAKPGEFVFFVRPLNTQERFRD